MTKGKTKAKPAKRGTRPAVGAGRATRATASKASRASLPARADSAKAEAAIGEWKRLYIANKHSALQLELARSVVKGIFDARGVDHIVSSFGTIALQHRGGAVKIEWEALARKLVPHEVLVQHLEDFATSTPASSVLAAPREWGVEAGC